MSMTMMWILLAVFFMVLEFVTANAMVSIWFFIGAVCAAIAAAFDAPQWGQMVAFIIVSIVMLIFTQPLIKRIRKKNPEELNANRIIGEKGIITQAVDILLGTGEMKIGGQIWTCRSVDQSVIKKDSIVEVVRIEGVKAIVKKI